MVLRGMQRKTKKNNILGIPHLTNLSLKGLTNQWGLRDQNTHTHWGLHSSHSRTCWERKSANRGEGEEGAALKMPAEPLLNVEAGLPLWSLNPTSPEEKESATLFFGVVSGFQDKGEKALKHGVQIPPNDGLLGSAPSGHVHFALLWSRINALPALRPALDKCVPIKLVACQLGFWSEARFGPGSVLQMSRGANSIMVLGSWHMSQIPGSTVVPNSK